MWCKDREIWLTTGHIPGIENTEADLASRVFNDQREWKLDPRVLTDVFTLFGKPDLDLFASRLNFQLPRYVSWIPDPNAVAVDAFTLDWGTQYNYAFPPFSRILQVLQKLERDQAEIILVAPHWPTQSWFPKLTRLLIQNPVLLLSQPRKGTSVKERLLLMACRLSGKAYETKAYQRELKKLSSSPGEKGPRNSTKYIYRSGPHSAVDGASIPFNHLYQRS